MGISFARICFIAEQTQTQIIPSTLFGSKVYGKILFTFLKYWMESIDKVNQGKKKGYLSCIS